MGKSVCLDIVFFLAHKHLKRVPENEISSQQQKKTSFNISTFSIEGIFDRKHLVSLNVTFQAGIYGSILII